MRISWSIFKEFVLSKGLSIQWIDLGEAYWLKAFDEQFELECLLEKNTPDISDFENNFKSDGNKKLGIQKDSDGSPLQRIKITTTGWHYQLHGAEFQTSQLNSINSTKANGTNFNFTSIKCYDQDDKELETQEGCDTNAVKTVIDWEPTHDYELIGGLFKFMTSPVSPIKLWVVGAPDIPEEYGGSKEFVTNMNLGYIGLEEGVLIDGRVPKYLTYSKVYHTNKTRFILTHEAGHKHDFHIFLEIFKE